MGLCRPTWWGIREYPLLKAVEAFGTVKHKDTLNEILYFANLKESVFEYHWGARSVYSEEVGHRISGHVYGSFEAKDREDAERDLSLSDYGLQLLELDRYEEIDSAVEWARDLLRGMSPRQVKVLASVHFVSWRDQSPAALHARIQRMSFKGDFTVEEVAWAMQFLEGKGLLEPALLEAEPARIPA